MSEPKLQTSYDSIAQAAAALNCSVAQLRKAKKEGAPGFRGSRVYPAELVPWLKAREEMGVVQSSEDALKERKLRLQCETIELELQKEREALWDSQLVKASWLCHMGAARQVLLAMPPSLAPTLAGHPVVEIERRLTAALDAALAKLRGNPYGSGEIECPHCEQKFGRTHDKQAIGETGGPGQDAAPVPAGEGNAAPAAQDADGVRRKQRRPQKRGNNIIRLDGKRVRENGPGKPGKARD